MRDGTTLRQRLLKPYSLLGRLSQTSTNLAPGKADIPWLAVGKIPHNGQVSFTLALRDDGSNEAIDDQKNAPRKIPS